MSLENRAAICWRLSHTVSFSTLGSDPEVKLLPLGSGPKVKSQATVLWRQTRGAAPDPGAAPSSRKEEPIVFGAKVPGTSVPKETPLLRFWAGEFYWGELSDGLL